MKLDMNSRRNFVAGICSALITVVLFDGAERASAQLCVEDFTSDTNPTLLASQV